MAEEREMKRILVTGGAGFIGSHICHRLLDEGCRVIAYDNLLTGSMKNIATLLGHPRFEFQHYDVTNFLYVDGDLDAILHFASPASPADFERLPIEILKVGSLGTHKTLGLAKAKNARLLLASTSECYGDPELNPQPETYWGIESDRNPRCLRRGQTFCGGDDDGLSPPSRRRRSDRSDLQYLRAEDATRRRSRDPKLLQAGDSR
jgi:nucleoside-diphosphate-sugar epimerase